MLHEAMSSTIISVTNTSVMLDQVSYITATREEDTTASNFLLTLAVDGNRPCQNCMAALSSAEAQRRLSQ